MVTHSADQSGYLLEFIGHALSVAQYVSLKHHTLDILCLMHN